jgi:short-subunit dehydrogenase
MSLRDKYGEWAFVAGGTVGIGGAWADRLARGGMNVVVSGRRAEVAEAKAKQLASDFGVEARAMTIDLGDVDVLDQVKAATEGLEIGFLVYNAGIASFAPFTDLDIDYELYRLRVNVRSLLALTLWFSKPMRERGRGAMVLMSSTGGLVGTPYIQTYSATKAYGMTLAEALWGELGDFGVDVLGVLPGNTIGQQYQEVPPGTPGFQTGAEVVEEAFACLGVEPLVITGAHNRQIVGPWSNLVERRDGILEMKAQIKAIAEQYPGPEA